MTTDAWLPPPPPPPLEQAPPWAAQPWPAAQPLVDRLPEAIAGRALVAAVAAGVLAQLLFAFQMLGINFPIWIAVVLVAAWRFRPPTARLDRLDIWLPIGAIVFAVFVALREDGMLLMFDGVAACSLTLASVVAFGGHSLTRGSWERVMGLAARAVAVYWVGAVYVAPGAKPLANAVAERRGERWRPLLRGLLIALPLLIVFGALFAAADAVFQVQLRNLVDLDFLGPELVFRAVLAALAGWLFAGTLVCAWLVRRTPTAPTAEAATGAARLGTTEALVVLLLLDAMFAAFALLQAAYLFGGLDTFAVSGMTYSDYARRGFFELIIAAFLAGAVIIVLDRLVAEHHNTHRLAAATLAALTGVVALSAFVRLGLYQAANGWTELRFYALAAIAFVGIGVLLTLASELANRAHWLPQLLLGSGLLVAIVCNVMGPQAYVTEQNLQRAIDPSFVAPGGKTGLNVEYLSRLGADSVPALISARDRLPADVQGAVDDVLRAHAHELAREAGAGWQSWNLARQRAQDALVSAGY
jgi:Domain of unknown function (DUF4173)